MRNPASIWRPLAAVGAAAAAAVTASAGVTHAAGPIRPDHGVEHMATTAVNLPPGVWTDVPVQVVLPRAGTYQIDADVRGRLSGTPSVNTYITARLWDVTTGAAVPHSERLVHQIIDGNAGAALTGGNATAAIDELITVDGPTTIAVQAVRRDAVGAASIAQIYSDSAGYTSLRYDRVIP